MTALESVRFAVRALVTNRLRSLLTMVGIAIGIGAVILLTALGNGAQAFVSNQITGLGGNSITVLPRQPPRNSNLSGRPLDAADLEALSDRQGTPDIATVSPVVTTSPTTTAASNTSSATLLGATPAYFAATNARIATGAAFTQQDVEQAAKVAVLGQQVVTDLYGLGADALGRQVQFNGVPFTVVGTLVSSGQGGPGGAVDQSAVAPLTTVQSSLTGYGAYSRLVVQSTSAATQAGATAEIESILDRLHGITNPNDRDYQVSSSAQLASVISSTLSTFTLLLGAIGGISLLVGGIGITNIMLVSVTERTREIGIRKAVGAPPSAILAQFLIEAVILSLLGGVVGVLVGLSSLLIHIGGFTPIVLPTAVVAAIVVSGAIGVFFGAFPARRAAHLPPIEALRRE